MDGEAGWLQQGYRRRPEPLRVLARVRRRDVRDRLAYGALALVSLYALFYGIADFGILDGNEALYVEAAREMALTHQWAVPQLDGLPYLEKPPLFVWLLSAANGLGGSVEFASRCVSAGAGLLLLLGTLHFAGRLGIGRKGVAAAFILATTLGMALMARVAMPDLLLTALFSLASFAFLVALREGRRGYARLAAALLGAAALAKGLLPLALFVLIAAACYAGEREWRPRIRTFVADPPVLLALFLPLACWLVAIDAALPGAASYFIVDEHILRFLGRREPHDYYSGSILYYVPRLFLFFFPWPGVLLSGWLTRSSEAAPERRQARRFLWLCVWIPFAFFSLSGAKANYYILPCLPAMAMLTADHLPDLLRRPGRTPLALAAVLPVGVLAGIVAVGLRDDASPLLAPLHGGAGATALAVLAGLALCTGLLIQAGWRRAALACLAVSMAPLSLQMRDLAIAADESFSARSIAAHIRGHYGDAVPVFLFEDFEAAGALPVYLGRTVPVIDSKSNDLHFGRRALRRHPNLVSAADLESSGPALIVVLRSRQADFRRSGLADRAREVASFGRAGLYRIG